MAVAINTMPQAYKEHIYNLSNEEKIHLVEFILQTMHSPKAEKKGNTDIEHIHHLDDMLYGSIKLPDNFDYKKELESALNEKYGL